MVNKNVDIQTAVDFMQNEHSKTVDILNNILTRLEKLEKSKKFINQTKEDQIKMEDKWIEQKLSEWQNGSVYCEDRDKGKIIKHMFERIKKLEEKSK